MHITTIMVDDQKIDPRWPASHEFFRFRAWIVGEDFNFADVATQSGDCVARTRIHRKFAIPTGVRKSLRKAKTTNRMSATDVPGSITPKYRAWGGIHGLIKLLAKPI